MSPLRSPLSTSPNLRQAQGAGTDEEVVRRSVAEAAQRVRLGEGTEVLRQEEP